MSLSLVHPFPLNTRLDWPYHLRQRLKQHDNDDGVCSLLPQEDWNPVRHKEASYQVSSMNDMSWASSLNLTIEPDIFYFRCLAHIINLATQALILKRSTSQYYNPESPEAHVPDVSAAQRDEVGLVRAICVKVHPFLPSFLSPIC